MDDRSPAKSAYAIAGETDSGGSTSGLISSQAQIAYRLVAERGFVPDGHPGLDELIALRLIVPTSGTDGHYTPVPRGAVERYLTETVQRQVAAAADMLAEIPKLFDGLPYGQYGDARRPSSATDEPPAPGKFPTSMLITGRDEVNSFIEQLVLATRHSLYTSQPGGPRSHEKLMISFPRDSAALRRGVKMKTIYASSAKSLATEDGRATDAWVKRMTALGAEVRTIASPFMQMIIRDEEEAFYADLSNPDAPGPRGWHVVHPGGVAFATRVFHNTWDRARPWSGGWDLANAVTTQAQRTILRGLCNGHPMEVIAKQIGVSVSRVKQALAALRKDLDVQTTYQVIAWWAASQEQDLP